ncbi:MAG TPA: glycosyltransferase family 39 protein [Anaerolineae bacterium]|nr:glycosyltransferase family 39 protein [Anaerolineae bacterium]
MTHARWDSLKTWSAFRVSAVASERLLGVSLFLLGMLTRLPFTSQILYHWDSVNFALALDRFDIASDQPHVPGYILYVALGQVVNALFRDPQTTWVAISLISSGLAVMAIYLLGRDLFSRETGLIAALFLTASPLFWFYGEVALPHSLDTFAVIGVVWLLYRLWKGDARFAIPAAIAIAVAGGLRPQTQVFLLPLALWASWRLGWRKLGPALAAMIVVDVLWVVPLVMSVGGIGRYLEVFNAFSQRFNESTTIFTGGLAGLARNLTKLGRYTLYGWGAAIVPAVLYGFRYLRKTALLDQMEKSNRKGRNPANSMRGRERKVLENLGVLCVRCGSIPAKAGRVLAPSWLGGEIAFWLWWIAPAAAYYTFIHMGQQGLVFVYLPALLLISAESLRRLTVGRKAMLWRVAGGLAALGAIIFVALPTYPFGGDRFKLLTWDTIRAQDRLYQERVVTVRHDFPAGRAILITSQWRHAEYYFADYPLVRFDIIAKWEAGEGQAAIDRAGDERLAASDLLGHPLAQGETAYLIVLDDELLPFLGSASTARAYASAGSTPITYLEIHPGDFITIDADSFGVMTATGYAASALLY